MKIDSWCNIFFSWVWMKLLRASSGEMSTNLASEGTFIQLCTSELSGIEMVSQALNKLEIVQRLNLIGKAFTRYKSSIFCWIVTSVLKLTSDLSVFFLFSVAACLRRTFFRFLLLWHVFQMQIEIGAQTSGKEVNRLCLWARLHFYTWILPKINLLLSPPTHTLRQIVETTLVWKLIDCIPIMNSMPPLFYSENWNFQKMFFWPRSRHLIFFPVSQPHKTFEPPQIWHCKFPRWCISTKEMLSKKLHPKNPGNSFVWLS